MIEQTIASADRQNLRLLLFRLSICVRTVVAMVVVVVVVVIDSVSNTLVVVSMTRCDCSFNSITAFARPPFDSA